MSNQIATARITPVRQPVDAQTTMPGSKSFTNRALVMAALAKGKSRILGFSESDDCNALINAFRRIGVAIEKTTQEIIVNGTDGKFREHNVKIDMGMAGTSMRFFTSIACLVPGTILLDGSERMRQRPIGELANALSSLGADITYLQTTGCPPIKIGGTIQGGKVKIKGNTSSQYFTSLLLVAPVLEDGLEIEAVNEQAEKSYVDMTINGLQGFGITVKNEVYKKYIVTSDQTYQATNYQVEGDASGASYFWAVAALTKGCIRITNINPNSSQGDMKFPDLLEKMGCVVRKNSQERWIEVQGPEQLEGIDVNMDSMPDTAQTLAVIAAFAKGTTKITGLSTLQNKETDRLLALQNELAKMAIKSKTGADYIIIEGGDPVGASIETYDDHRMAMAFSIAGTKICGVEILDPMVVSKSFPDFWEKFENIGVEIKIS